HTRGRRCGEQGNVVQREEVDVNPDPGGHVAAMLARYRALLLADLAGPPSAARQAQIQDLAEQLRRSHEAVLVEVEKQVRAMKDTMAKAGTKAAGKDAGNKQPEAGAGQPAEAPPPGRYIDPHLGEKLRGQLLGSLDQGAER